MYVYMHGVYMFVYNVNILHVRTSAFSYPYLQVSGFRVPTGTQRLTGAQVPYLEERSICVEPT